MKTATLIYSGGMDSTTLLYWLIRDGYDVHPIGIHYGQRHRKELGAAWQICESLGVNFELVDLSGLSRFMIGSSQTDPAVNVPEGHYADPIMRQTVVPNRNMLLLAVAGVVACGRHDEIVAYGAIKGDYEVYPDCRPSFVEAMSKAFDSCDWHAPTLMVPFINMTKAEIVTIGKTLGVPYHQTWTCYNGMRWHCGKCGSCTERREAFQQARVGDPTHYSHPLEEART